jgi:hypothetical protein
MGQYLPGSGRLGGRTEQRIWDIRTLSQIGGEPAHPGEGDAPLGIILAFSETARGQLA